jgi:hypothetical protein
LRMLALSIDRCSPDHSLITVTIGCIGAGVKAAASVEKFGRDSRNRRILTIGASLAGGPLGVDRDVSLSQASRQHAPTGCGIFKREVNAGKPCRMPVALESPRASPRGANRSRIASMVAAGCLTPIFFCGGGGCMRKLLLAGRMKGCIKEFY